MEGNAVKKILVSLVVCALFLSCAGVYQPKERGHEMVSLIPRPIEVKELNARFVLNRYTAITAESPELKSVGEYLRDALYRLRRLSLPNISEMKEDTRKAIVLSLCSSIPNPEGYELIIDNNGIRITGKEQAGVFHGIQTLLQLIPIREQEIEKTTGIPQYVLSGIRISDFPRFPWRGMHLDVCRHFFPADFIKRYIDLLAMHKMNVFHWHLTDDQGWRIEIGAYPRLTEIGAWRVDREDEPWDNRKPQCAGDKAAYGGYYTLSEIREIVAYATERFVTIVPEIEMPAHATAALAAYPELSCTGGPFTVMPGGVWPIVDIYCAGNEKTFEFLENVLGEIIDLFPGKYIHIGGDEATKDNWKRCAKCQARIHAGGLKDEFELQSYFIKRIERFLVSKNRRLIGWDEILEGGLPPEATVMSWRGMQGGIAATRAGHDVIMTPMSHCYFDYYQTLSDEPRPIGKHLPLDKVYAFDPVPDSLEADKRHFILGAQGNVWTEFMPTPERVEYMALPRMCALAEVVWSPKEQRDVEDFKRRMAVHYNRLDLMGVHYCPPASH